ncbi:DNA-packaging protein [Methylobacterium oxalidis]|uniref:Large terminase n=1 Tax=Methylobacterium oxalidis TaxID=944322 RepID=A0A512JA55_9HYPH|nr:terminase family protein [Methylobacterium oxalidis]GEP06769.1 large terminase [Methylobacterium oxalidis]GLS67977.1 large terminase [Methylobacterium oxalidis]
MRRSQASGRIQGFLESLPPHLLLALQRDWLHLARPDQLPPCEAAPGRPAWTTWAVIGGRGCGKTRTGAEWVSALATGDPAFTGEPVGRIALVGETFADVRDVMIEGPSGLLALPARAARPRWSPSRRRVEWPNGAVALAFSAEEPDSLRGPQFGAAWSDEVAKWRYAEAAYDMLQFGLRVGTRPRGLVTTTPRPIPLLRRLLSDPRTVVSRARTADNAPNLAPAFLAEVVGRYAGTRLGRQELDGELIEDRADALWTRDGLEAARVAALPEPLARIVVAVDPPASSRAGADACGIVAAGALGATAYVLADATLARATPQAWASAALALYHRLGADALVVEVNQGGEMAEAVIREIDPGVPVTAVRASRGKYLRAEPVSVLYAQGRVRHVGALPALEDEMCDFIVRPLTC